VSNWHHRQGKKPIPEVYGRSRLITFLENYFLQPGDPVAVTSLSASSYISASSFYGNGAALTNITASAVEVADGPEMSLQFRYNSPIGREISGSANLMFLTGSTDVLQLTGNLGVAGKAGIGTSDPKVVLDAHHNPTSLSNDTGGGEVVTFGTEDGTDTLAAGKLMYLNASGVWKYTDADAPATGGSQLLAIALGGSVSDGLLLRGFFDMTTYLAGTFDQGVPVYVSTTASQGDVGIPNGSGDFVRVVGYCTDTANVIYFNPDGTYIEIS